MRPFVRACPDLFLHLVKIWHFQLIFLAETLRLPLIFAYSDLDVEQYRHNSLTS